MPHLESTHIDSKIKLFTTRSLKHVRLEVSTAVWMMMMMMMIMFLWFLAPPVLVGRCQRFGEIPSPSSVLNMVPKFRSSSSLG
jgi:hypothetical protein